MPVNPKEAHFFSQLTQKAATKSNKPLSETTLAESRQQVAGGFMLTGCSLTDSHSFETTATARDGYSIPIRIYNHHLPLTAPLLVYYMGNGYIYDLFKVNSAICARIAKHVSARVAIINMRLAPENPLPIPIYDGFDAVQSLVKQFSPHHLTLCGYCTGAGCTLAMTHLAQQAKTFLIDHLILLNGLYDLTFGHQAYRAYENEDLSLSQEFLDYLIAQQQLKPGERENPLYSPYFLNTLALLPTTTIISGEYDRDRSGSEALFQKLQEKGVVVEKIILTGQMHNTIIFQEQLGDSKDPAQVIAEVAAAKWSSLQRA